MFKMFRTEPQQRCAVEEAALSMVSAPLLPILPEFADPLRAALAGAGRDLDTTVQLVGGEPALCASVLLCANARAFMPWSRTADVRRALLRIEVDARAAHLAELLVQQTWQPATPQALALLRSHRADSLKVAHAARHLAAGFGPPLAGSAHVAGLLHRIGALLLIVAADRARSAGTQTPDLDELLQQRQDTVGHALLTAARLPGDMARLPLRYSGEHAAGRVQLADLVLAARSLTNDVQQPIEPAHIRALDRIGIARTEIGVRRREVTQVLTALAA